MSVLFEKVVPSATQSIRHDHEHIAALFHKFTPDVSPATCAALVRNLCTALEIHAQLEEELFYPALRAAGLEDPVLNRSIPDHDEMRRFATELRSLDEQDDELMPLLHELMRTVLHHVADEEAVLLPRAEQLLGSERLAELGAQMARRRAELASPHAGEMAHDMARIAPAKTAMLTLGAMTAGVLLAQAWRHRRGHHL